MPGVSALAKAGAQIIEGCCGTTPLHIQEMIRVLSEEQEKGILPIKRAEYVEEKVVYKNPMVCYHKEWDEDSFMIWLMTFQMMMKMTWSASMEMMGRTWQCSSCLAADFEEGSNYCVQQCRGYEEAIRRAPNLPNIYLTTDFDKSEMDKIIKIAEKYGVKIIEGEL